MPSQKMLNELNELHHEFLALGTCVEELVAGAVRAIREPGSDGSTPMLVCEALAERSSRIADRCRRIVLLYQPVAVDFREVTAMLRMAAELEHVGNLAVEITERATTIAALPVPVPEGLSRLAAMATGMVRRALDAYTLLDAVPVRPVTRTRAEVTDLTEGLTQWLVGVMRADPEAVEPGLGLFAVIQNLRHLAEYATALTEEVAFLTEAPKEPPHASSNS